MSRSVTEDPRRTVEEASEPHVAKSHHHVEHQLSAGRAFEKRGNSVFDVSPRLELPSFSRVAEVAEYRR